MNGENQLEVIVKESGLEKTKADYILENFQHYFSVASEWERRAKEIVVTSDDQRDVMALARIGRLALKEKRITLEKERKRLKEQSLREGKAIDGIANVLKALIEPIEDYLDKQENFVQYKKAEAARIAAIEYEKKMEQERIAKEKAEAEERERVRLENERLKKEAAERELQMQRERAEAEAKLAAERLAAEKKQRLIEEAARLEKEKQEAIIRMEREKARAEQERQEKAIAEQQAKAEEERRAAREREAAASKKAAEEKSTLEAELKAKAEEERKTKVELAAAEDRMKGIISCPSCGHKFSNSSNKTA